jgi:hypothetical protein
VDNGLRHIPVLNRPAGGGVIVEAITFWWHPGTTAINAWMLDKEGGTIRIYAGAMTREIKSGGGRLEEPLPGAIFVEMFPERKQSRWAYLTPEKVGPVWIVSVDGSLITLASSNGAYFVFDIEKLEYISHGTKRATPSIGTDKGTIVQNGTVPYKEFSQYNDEYRFYNHWATKHDNDQILIFAGTDIRKNPNGMVLVITIHDDESGGYSREAKIYEVPQTHGAVRIVDANGNKVTMVSFEGKPIIFDILSNTFTFPKALSDQDLGSKFDVLPFANKTVSHPENTLIPAPSITNPYP